MIKEQENLFFRNTLSKKRTILCRTQIMYLKELQSCDRKLLLCMPQKYTKTQPAF